MGPPAYAFPPLFRQNGPYPRQSDSFYSIQGQLITFRCNTKATLKQSNFKRKHCQRHNGPEGWVHLTKVTSWGYITSSNTNLNQISSSESRLSIKHLVLTVWTKVKLNDQTSAPKQIVANMILSINISNSNNLKKFWVGIFTCQGHINQVY